MDDFELLDAWIGGDTKAGGELYQRHADSLLAHFTSLAGPEHREDLTHETFARLIKSRESFRRECSVRTFLFTIARYVFYEHLRSSYKADFDPLTDSVCDIAGPGLSTVTRQTQAYERLLVCLRELPVEEQTLLTLYTWDNLTAAELAVMFESNENTIRSRVLKIKLRLQERLAALPAVASMSSEEVDDRLAELRWVLQYGLGQAGEDDEDDE